jgi:hypothetical protein
MNFLDNPPKIKQCYSLKPLGHFIVTVSPNMQAMNFAVLRSHLLIGGAAIYRYVSDLNADFNEGIPCTVRPLIAAVLWLSATNVIANRCTQ